MRSFEIFVAPERDSATRPVMADGLDATPFPASRERGAGRRESAREVLDVFIEGANVTARVADTHASSVLRDLGFALVDLARASHGKRIVRFYDDPWELCVERIGPVASLSVYRAGSDPSIAAYDRAVPFEDVVQGARDAIAAVLARGAASHAIAVELRAADEGLRLADLDAPLSGVATPAPSRVAIELDGSAALSFAAEFMMRATPLMTRARGQKGSSGAERRASAEPSVERTDVHALLFRGRMRAMVREHVVDLAEGHPFLLAERLVEIARHLVEAWERGQAHQERAEGGGVVVGVRLAPDGSLALTLGAPPTNGQTFPALGVTEFIEASLAFGRALVRAVLRRDRTQGQNLRLSAFRRQLREMSDVLREACREDAKVNPSPEAYRAFARAPKSDLASRSTPTTPAPSRLRYASRWRALVPGIDLRATFLCGDRLIVGAAAETFCLDRSRGEVIWRVETQRATSVVTPGGIARLHPDGALAVHDFGTGEVTLRSWLAPRLGGPPAGAVVHVPGLPRLLILTEGERHLVAIDLTSGEPRWRYAWGRRGALRLKRSGKLLYFTTGDSALTALDVLTGAVVWRVRDRLCFRAPPLLDHDAMFAVAGGASSATKLHAIDPFSGRVRWSAPVPSASCRPGCAADLPSGESCTVEGVPLAASGIVACAVRERNGLKLAAWHKDSGALAWTSTAFVAPSGTSWLAVDDLFIGNTPTGKLVAIEAATGAVRYRHVLGSVLETDVPRRLEPILRSGALFVPHTDVHVFRPHDGAELGTIGPCEAIPDLLRVDERCDVYIAEESGHLVSFAAGPRLTLVK